MKVWILDNKSDKRKRRSEKEARKADFEIAKNRDEAEVVALHETDAFGLAPYAENSQFEEKLIIVFSGGGTVELTKEDTKSRRVLRISFSVPRDSYITYNSWTRISGLIEQRDDKYFWKECELVHAYPERLMALSILCQGYLAVHAEHYKQHLKEIEPALQQMGWKKFREGQKQNLLPGDLSDKRKEVRNPAWWRVFNGEENPIEKAKEEWNLDPVDGRDVVEKLLCRVTESKEPLADDDLGMVAEAYCALVERLGGSPCQA